MTLNSLNILKTKLSKISLNNEFLELNIKDAFEHPFFIIFSFFNKVLLYIMKKLVIILLFVIVIKSLSFSQTQNLISNLSGSGSEQDPVLIYSVNDLKLLSKFVMDGPDYSTSTAGKYFTLMNDIYFQESDLIFDLDNDGIIESNFIPIGGRKDTLESSNFRLFQGIFDGNRHIIYGLKIKYSSISYVGLFGCTWNAEIRNLGIENGEFSGNGCVAPLCGQIRGKVEYCFSRNCNIYNNYWFSGGLFGASYQKSEINNCYSSNCEVTGTMWVGGFIGNNNDTTVIKNSYTTNMVYTTDNSSSYGGFNGSNESESIIENCYHIDNWAGTENVDQIPQSQIVPEKNIAFLKSQEFVDSLNNIQDSLLSSDIPEETLKAIWNSDISPELNCGFPILWWEHTIITNITERYNDKTSLYPNPTKNNITIENSYNSKYILLDINGKIIKKGIIPNNFYQLNLVDLTSGIYLIQITNNNNVKINKIIKE